jgi:MAF protein
MALPQLVLASASPRRARLLQLLGLTFQVDVSAVDEDLQTPRSAEERAQELALDKARAVAARHAGRIILAADTLIAFRGQLLGKPGDAGEATAMLRSLRGHWHSVVTGVAVIGEQGEEYTGHEATRVLMRDYSDAEISAYVASGDPMDKAAAYAIQHRGFHPVDKLDVCYTNVMGLPLCTTVELLARAGLGVTIEGAGMRTGRCAWCLAAQRDSG